MDEKTVRENLRSFIKREFIRDESYDLTDTEGIITGGMMDSFSLTEFAVYAGSRIFIGGPEFVPRSHAVGDKVNILRQLDARGAVADRRLAPWSCGCRYPREHLSSHRYSVSRKL